MVLLFLKSNFCILYAQDLISDKPVISGKKNIAIWAGMMVQCVKVLAMQAGRHDGLSCVPGIHRGKLE